MLILCRSELYLKRDKKLDKREKTEYIFTTQFNLSKNKNRIIDIFLVK